MAIKETVILERSSADIPWAHEAVSFTVVDTSGMYNATVIESEDKLTHTTVREWLNDIDFVTEKSRSNTTNNKKFHNYNIANKIKITRIFEVI